MGLRDKLKDLFIPHEGNDHKPDILERVSVGIMLLLILLTFAMANIQALLWIGSSHLVSTILPAIIVDLTNTERASGHLGTLHRNPVLDQAATLKAHDMATNSYFAHYSPAGVSPWHWFDAVSYDFVYAGENLAVNFTDSGDVVTAWMNSPSHRENILNGSYTEIGVGTATGTYKGYPTVFVVQLFGTPRPIAQTSTPQVAGIETQKPQQQVTLETVVASSSNAVPSLRSVAPATFKTSTVGGTTQSPSTTPPTSDATNTEPTTSVEFATVDGTPIIYSDLATTSRGSTTLIGTVEQEHTNTPNTSQQVSFFARSATQPSLWLQMVYGVLTGIVVIALILSIVIEWRKQHPIQMVYAAGLITLMVFLLKIHLALTAGVTIL